MADQESIQSVYINGKCSLPIAPVSWPMLQQE